MTSVSESQYVTESMNIEGNLGAFFGNNGSGGILREFLAGHRT